MKVVNKLVKSLEDLKKFKKSLIDHFIKWWNALKPALIQFKERCITVLIQFKERCIKFWNAFKTALIQFKERCITVLIQFKEKCIKGWNALKPALIQFKERCITVLIQFKDLWINFLYGNRPPGSQPLSLYKILVVPFLQLFTISRFYSIFSRFESKLGKFNTGLILLCFIFIILPIVFLVYTCLPVNYPHMIILPTSVSTVLTIYIYILQRLMITWAATGLFVLFLRGTIEWLGYYMVDENTVEDSILSRALHLLAQFINIYFEYWMKTIKLQIKKIHIGYVFAIVFYALIVGLLNLSSLNFLIPSSMYDFSDNIFMLDTTAIHNFTEIMNSLKPNTNNKLFPLIIGFTSSTKELIFDTLEHFNLLIDNVEAYSVKLLLDNEEFKFPPVVSQDGLNFLERIWNIVIEILNFLAVFVLIQVSFKHNKRLKDIKDIELIYPMPLKDFIKMLRDRPKQDKERLYIIVLKVFIKMLID
jgi:hypothetical protein